MFSKASDIRGLVGRNRLETNQKADRYTWFEEELKGYYGLGA